MLILVVAMALSAVQPSQSQAREGQADRFIVVGIDIIPP